MTDERWIVIPRWDEFQHRDMARSTIPPWIKNLTRVLHDDDYLDLTLSQRGLLHGLWLLYASHRRVLSETQAKRKLCTSDAEARYWRGHIEALNHAGYVEISASRPARHLASRDDSLEVEVEREGFKKTPKSAREPDRTAFLIRTMISNGALTTLIDLEAELSHHPTLTDHHRDALRAAIAPTNGNSAGGEGEHQTDTAPGNDPPASFDPTVF